MPKVTISGVPGVDGEYDLDLGRQFTMGELHTIKKISGVRAGEITEAFAALDSDLIVALAMITLERAGRTVPADLLWGAEMGAIQFEQTDAEKAEEEEEREPDPTGSVPSADEEKPAGSEPSGQPLNGGGENPEIIPLRIGAQD